MFADSKCNPPDIMVCYRVQKDGSTNCPNLNSAANCKSNQLSNGLNNQQTINAMSLDPQAQADAIRQGRLGPSGLPLKQSKSRELRASIMYSGCDCEKKNGLQDDCLRSECRGSPQCLTKPNPTCGPSEFSNGKHLEMKRLAMEKKIAVYKAQQRMKELAPPGSNAVSNNIATSAVNYNDGDEGEYCCYEAVAIGGALICNGVNINLG